MISAISTEPIPTSSANSAAGEETLPEGIPAAGHRRKTREQIRAEAAQARIDKQHLPVTKVPIDSVRRQIRMREELSWENDVRTMAKSIPAVRRMVDEFDALKVHAIILENKLRELGVTLPEPNAAGLIETSPALAG